MTGLRVRTHREERRKRGEGESKERLQMKDVYRHGRGWMERQRVKDRR